MKRFPLQYLYDQNFLIPLVLSNEIDTDLFTLTFWHKLAYWPMGFPLFILKVTLLVSRVDSASQQSRLWKLAESTLLTSNTGFYYLWFIIAPLPVGKGVNIYFKIIITFCSKKAFLMTFSSSISINEDKACLSFYHY